MLNKTLREHSNGNVTSLPRELRTASSRGRFGERLQRDPCLKRTSKHDNNIGQRQPMTSLHGMTTV